MDTDVDHGELGSRLVSAEDSAGRVAWEDAWDDGSGKRDACGCAVFG